MMSFNKKLVAVALLSVVFGQAMAMKRLGDGSGYSNPSKRPKTSHEIIAQIDYSKSTITSSFPVDANNIPKTDQFPFDGGNYVPQQSFTITGSETANKSATNTKDLMVSIQESRSVGRLSDEYCRNKLLSAITKGDLPNVSTYLEKVPVINPSEVSLIFSSNVLTEFQKITLLPQLQQLKVNLDQSDPSCVGSTPLHLAAEKDHPELVEALLRTGCSPNVTNNLRQTPLFGTTDPQVAGILYRAGAQLDHEDHKGRTPLFSVGTLYQADTKTAQFYVVNDPGLIEHTDRNEENAFKYAKRKFNNPNKGLQDEETARDHIIAPVIFDSKSMGNPVLGQRKREMGHRFSLNNITF